MVAPVGGRASLQYNSLLLPIAGRVQGRKRRRLDVAWRWFGDEVLAHIGGEGLHFGLAGAQGALEGADLVGWERAGAEARRVASRPS
jgi:hypothetical protein